MHVCLQVDDDTVLSHQFTTLFRQHRAAAGCQNHVVALHQIANGRSFALAKAGLALDVENMRDRHAGALLDFLVAVHKDLAQMFGQRSPHGGFARAHHAHQNQVAGLKLATIPLSIAWLGAIVWLTALHVAIVNHKNKSPDWAGPWFEQLAKSAKAHLVFHDFGSDENQQLRLGVALDVILEQPADNGHIPQQRNLLGGIGKILGEDAADHHRAAIFNQYLRVYFFGIDARHTAIYCSHSVLVGRHLHIDMVVRCNLRGYTETQRRILE